MKIFYKQDTTELKFIDIDISELEEFKNVLNAVRFFSDNRKNTKSEILVVRRYAVEKPLFEKFDLDYAAQENIDLEKLVYEKYGEDRKLDDERTQF